MFVLPFLFLFEGFLCACVFFFFVSSVVCFVCLFLKSSQSGGISCFVFLHFPLLFEVCTSHFQTGVTIFVRDLGIKVVTQR